MAHLKIQHVGPIKNVDIDINKINVIIGLQSSGKSTISKIACFCSWVEKWGCLHRTFDQFTKPDKFYTELVRFHKLDGYFSNESYIEYESDVIHLCYGHKKQIPELEWNESFFDDEIDVIHICYNHKKQLLKFEWKDRFAYKRCKIAYIPSERNLVSVIDNWFEVKFKDNNIKNFMIDWSDARKLCTKEKLLPIFQLNAQYYYDSSRDKDVVIVKGKETTLDLTNTSSGLQSVIPLKVVVEYLTTHIYNTDIPISPQETVLHKDLRFELLKEQYLSRELKEQGWYEQVLKQLTDTQYTKLWYC
ncbi:hypothetical protein Barb6_03686 [Bacteroidales bacterium Barb6]|nr:hypothetical protein Barb6_03686 [Bacteroidales bacterium Barb6]